VLSFTAEEVWEHIPGDREESVHLATFEVPSSDQTAESFLDEPVKRLLGLRDTVLAELEELRQAGTIGKSEEARMVFAGDTSTVVEDLAITGIDLSRFLIVSDAHEGSVEGDGSGVAAYPGLRVSVGLYEAHTCSRCWRRVEKPVADAELPDLCERCHGVVSRLLQEGRAELRQVDG
jgi:isoleucyl-tRNA synthetase